MSDCDSEVDKYELKKYSLVRFVHRGRKRQTEAVDIVPSKWLDFDKSKGRCVTKFMAGPYGEEDLKLIHDLVLHNADAPEDWPTFSIEQVGRAMTYEEGLKKIKLLETEANVLTLESEDSASEAQRQLTLAVKRQKLSAESKQHKQTFLSSMDCDNHIMQDITNTPAASQPTSNWKKKLTKRSYEFESQTSCNKSTSNTPSDIKFQLSPAVCENVHICVDGLVNNNTVMASEMHKSVEHSNVEFEPTIVSTSSLSLGENVMNEPIYYNDVPCKPSFEVEVLMRLDQIASDIAEIKQDVTLIKTSQSSTANFLSDKKIVARSVCNLEEKYHISIPLKDYAEFEAFEVKLKTDNYFKKDIYIELKSTMDKDFVISKSLVKMIKRFLAKDLANLFTAMRASHINKEKYKFKPTELCTIMQSVITKLRNERSMITKEEDFNSALSDVLTNVYKWK